MPYLEANRYLYLMTPLGADKLLLRGFTGQEGLSQLFSFQLFLLAENATDVDFKRLIGQNVSFGIQRGESILEPRHMNGIVVQLSQGARDHDFTEYHMTVAPDVWKLTRKFRSRIFQHISVPDILRLVFAGFDAAYEIQGEFEPREYCTQYQESDFDFASRLMEEEGIYYFFKFTEGAHKLVLANTPQSHSEVPGDPNVIYEEVAGGTRDEERIHSWHKAQSWGPGKFTLWDHHFQLPHKNLAADQPVIDEIQVGKVQHKLKLGNPDLEIYRHPGDYAYRFDGIDKGGGEKPDLGKIFQDNKRTVGIRMQQTETPMLTISGAGNHPQITAGHKFTLQKHFNGDGQYVINAVSHNASEGDFRSETGGTSEDHYNNSFTCLPYALPYRPPCVTRRPVVSGPVSGLVVGPAGEEIFTDKYGRIKVQAFWDRIGTFDADSSCWMQLATSWAGQNWGSIHLPRIGQEVLITFLEGNPDHPVVTGSVYNPEQMPPYKLPDHKTVSTLKSRSSLKGGPDNFNEMRFEDLMDKEQVFIHAERDKDERTKAESREWVGANRHLMVQQNQKEVVAQNKHSKVTGNYVFETDGNKDITTQGNVCESVGGNRDVAVSGTHTEQVGGKMSLTVGASMEQKTATKFAHAAGQEIHLKAGMKVIIEAGAQISLVGPGGFVDIGPAGVTIQGTMVLINSGGAAGSGSGSSPDSPKSPKAPEAPDQADDGTKFDKM